MDAQAKAVEEARMASEKESAKALQATIDNFHQQQRPWVWHSLMHSDNLFSDFSEATDVHWINYGHSPAMNFNGVGKVFCGRNALRDAYSFLDKEASKAPLRQGTVIVPAVLSNPPNPTSGDPLNPQIPYDTYMSDLMTPADGATCRLQGPQVTVVHMTYFDNFGKAYSAELCNGFRFQVQRGYIASGNCPLHNHM